MQRFTALTATAIAAAILAACTEDAGTDEGQVDNGVSGPVGDAPAVPLVNASGEIIGEVRGGDGDRGANLLIVARGLPPGTHGLHIHEVGVCETPGFTSAGPHWNPTGAQHGGENPQGAHLGDLQNVTVGDNGELRAEILVPGTYLRTAGRDAQGARQILDNDGAALVLHAKADDYRTDPSGDSGDRIACAVLGSPAPGTTVGQAASGAATNSTGGNAMSNGSATNSATTNGT